MLNIYLNKTGYALSRAIKKFLSEYIGIGPAVQVFFYLYGKNEMYMSINKTSENNIVDK